MDEYIDREQAIKNAVGALKGVSHITAVDVATALEETPTADVVPKSEVDKWYCEYHTIKEVLKQEKMYHRETEKLVDKYCIELEKAKAENETLKDNNEHLAVMLEETRIELEAMRGAANSLKMHYEKAEAEIERLQAEKEALIKNYAECMKDYASEIFAKIETLLALNILVGDVFTGKYFDADLENDLAELKKKYTEGYDGRV